jgi:hypothetical protein
MSSSRPPLSNWWNTPAGARPTLVTNPTVDDCLLLELPKINDPRGNLTFLENGDFLPFDMNRIFFLYDVPGGARRAGHALKSCSQILVATSGSFDVVLSDGVQTRKVQLNRPYYGLHIPPRIWRELENFSSGSVCLVIASEAYDEQGYYRDFESFRRAVQGG